MEEEHLAWIVWRDYPSTVKHDCDQSHWTRLLWEGTGKPGRIWRVTFAQTFAGGILGYRAARKNRVTDLQTRGTGILAPGRTGDSGRTAPCPARSALTGELPPELWGLVG